ncbi:putative eukaryotic translation initiation factor eIF-2C4 [Talaromyces proteolyticus]|uniref:Eukaryotic translation initiation factor eIF-2C4 n=1 Tax=Talaromyces proteolyticus TaxID=1131652 RepID=A0AAD4KIU3_9EURO|nr:putative eukaryotic translation initiation factor eIF-2C4 [Talaromyces proteolyticus]KAH8692689.1 putative eukaryotic translation initiation factor eIF-2C4 [Talaromyces proteolyticus]
MDHGTSVARPGFNENGKEVELKTNCYQISQFPTKKIYQYDVTIVKAGNESATVTSTARKLVWASDIRKSKFRQMIYDGAKLAWSDNSYDDPSGNLVQLGDYTKKELARDKTSAFRLMVRKSKVINLQVLESWLQKKYSFDESVLEAVNFLDHLMREVPSTKHTPIKRAFYNEKEDGGNLHNNLNVLKGYYQAIRAAINGRLIVNVDSVLCVFWRQASLSSHADTFLSLFDWQKTAKALKPRLNNPKNPWEGYEYSPAHKYIWSKMRHLEVRPMHPGCIVTRSFHIYQVSTANAHKATFPLKDAASGKERTISVAAFFKEKYNQVLHCPELPVVEMTKKGVLYPMECLEVAPLQRYNHKLDERQTADMLRIAVRKPEIRFGDIAKAKTRLDHAGDPVLKHFGMKISDAPIITKARLLPAPDIQFANAKIDPQTQGRWDLRGKKFIETNRFPLSSWGVGVFKQGRNALTKTEAEKWAEGFKNQYMGHGGKVKSSPFVTELTGDTAMAIQRLFEGTGNHFKQRPQLLIIMNCDCRFGVPSQVVQCAQYMSNVSMKVNAKLGGVTCKAVPKFKEAQIKPGSIIIGADVSHASPGSLAPSLTAISVSADKVGAKYMGRCETGLRRVEIIDEQNMKEMLVPLVDQWTKTVGQGRRPQNVYYFRDGVSTGQFAQVLAKEVPMIKDVIHHGSGDKLPPKVTVVIANKRHHLRAVPKPTDKSAADRNGNPLPGTLIERDITSPHTWDFLLIAHVALQGTSQPVHYHVIRDEIGHSATHLQNMIYNHSYQYVRSTTSVSLFPAIYYAHLISNRARPHESVSEEQGPTSGAYIKLDKHTEKTGSGSSNPNALSKMEGVDDTPPRLLKMVQNETRNHLEMWFV